MEITSVGNDIESIAAPDKRSAEDSNEDVAANMRNQEKDADYYEKLYKILFADSLDHWINFRPTQNRDVYPCYACGNMFSTQRAYVDHVQRSTTVIKFRCNYCTQIPSIKSTNLCSFHLHMRSHFTAKKGTIDLSLIILWKRADKPGFDFSQGTYDMYNIVPNEEGLSRLINTQFYLADPSCKGKQFVNLKPYWVMYCRDINNPDLPGLVMKQISSNIPYCRFVYAPIVVIKKKLPFENSNAVNCLSQDNKQSLPSTSDELSSQSEGSSSIESSIQVENLNSISEQLPFVNAVPAKPITYERIKVRINGYKNSYDSLSKQQTLHPNVSPAQLPENVMLNAALMSDKVSSSTIKNQDIVEKHDENHIRTEHQTLGGKEDQLGNLVADPKDIEHVDEALEVQVKLEDPDYNVELGDYKIIEPIMSTITCHECGNEVKTLNEHFASDNRPTNDLLKCQVCPYVAITLCSFMAHQRIHSQAAPPYVCPEDGEKFTSRKELEFHMQEVCFHMWKVLRYQCPGPTCKRIFAATSTLTSHFITHVPVMDVCPVCRVYAEQGGLEYHKIMHHSPDVIKKVRVCTVCNKGAKAQSEIDDFVEHVKYHCTDTSLRIYVYKSSCCKSYFRSRLALFQHRNSCPKRIDSNVMDIIKSGMAVHFKKGPRSGFVKCVLCNEFYRPDLIRDHLRYSERNDTQIEACKYRTPVVILENDLKNVPPDINTFRIISITDFSKISNVKKRRKKSNTPNKSKKPTIDFDKEFEPLKPITFNGMYTCKMCMYDEVDRTLFQQHIVRHRDNATTYQCMECGECFVVKPSLVKHLMFIHQIVDADEYLKENNCFNEKVVKEMEEQMVLKSYQCHLCRVKFEDDASLNKHIRVHGMAFLTNS